MPVLICLVRSLKFNCVPKIAGIDVYTKKSYFKRKREQRYETLIKNFKNHSKPKLNVFVLIKGIS